MAKTDLKLTIGGRPFQQLVGSWAERTFPVSTEASIVTHMLREAQELRGAISEMNAIAASRDLAREGRERYCCELDDARRAAMTEAADIYLCLLHLAHKMGFDLETVAYAKHRINTRREWGEPDEEGVVEHIRDEAPASTGTHFFDQFGDGEMGPGR